MSTLNEIATKASRLDKKTNKNRAYEIITDLIEQSEAPNDDQLAALYNFFIPPPRKIKTCFQWVNMAVDKKEERYNLRHVYVADGVMVATDGHRLHLMPTDLDEGFYDKNGVRIEVDAKFPDYSRVISEMKGERYSWTREDCKVIVSDVEIYKLSNGATVNKKYWDEATTGEETVDFYQDGKYDPIRIVFEDPDKIAVVMPGRW